MPVIFTGSSDEGQLLGKPHVLLTKTLSSKTCSIPKSDILNCKRNSSLTQDTSQTHKPVNLEIESVFKCSVQLFDAEKESNIFTSCCPLCSVFRKSVTKAVDFLTPKKKKKALAVRQNNDLYLPVDKSYLFM